MDKLNNIVLLIQHYLADYILIILLLGGGVIFTIGSDLSRYVDLRPGGKERLADCFRKKERREKTVCHHFRHLQRLLQHR